VADPDNGINYDPDPIVVKLLDSKGGLVPDVCLVGFLGLSSQPNHRRLYSDLTFTSYVEIPVPAIHDRKPLEPADPDSPSVVFVAAEERVLHYAVTVRSIEAGVLAGSITQAHMASASSPDDPEVMDTAISCWGFITCGGNINPCKARFVVGGSGARARGQSLPAIAVPPSPATAPPRRTKRRSGG
jgi:hypothetical protein